MAILKRIWRVVRANINSLIDDLEDPEKVLEQVVAELQKNLIELRQAVAAAFATLKRTERQLAQNEAAAQQWFRRAQFALEREDENSARVALLRRQTYQNYARSLQIQVEQHREITDRLKQEMRTLEIKLAEAKIKKDMYIARAKSAVTAQKIEELVGDLSWGTSLNVFQRMEEKVIELEAQTELIKNLQFDSLERKFASLENQESNIDLEKQLAKMKAEQNNSKPPKSAAIAASELES